MRGRARTDAATGHCRRVDFAGAHPPRAGSRAPEIGQESGVRPDRLMPAAIALGTSTFTMSMLPGTPAVHNAIPSRGALRADHAGGRERYLVRQRRPGHGHPGADRAEPPPADRSARQRGCRRQRLRASHRQRREPGGLRHRGGRPARLRAGARVGARHRGRSAGVPRRLHQSESRAPSARSLGPLRPMDWTGETLGTSACSALFGPQVRAAGSGRRVGPIRTRP